jgi:hypothetical protein
MAYTLNQFGTRVLRDLGLLGAEETPSSADLNWATSKIENIIQTLSAKRISIWDGSSVSIPNEVAEPLSARVALSVAPSFGQTDIVTATAAIDSVEKELRVLSARPATGAVVDADYF